MKSSLPATSLCTYRCTWMERRGHRGCRSIASPFFPFGANQRKVKYPLEEKYPSKESIASEQSLSSEQIVPSKKRKVSLQREQSIHSEQSLSSEQRYPFRAKYPFREKSPFRAKSLQSKVIPSRSRRRVLTQTHDHGTHGPPPQHNPNGGPCNSRKKSYAPKSGDRVDDPPDTSNSTPPAAHSTGKRKVGDGR